MAAKVAPEMMAAKVAAVEAARTDQVHGGRSVNDAGTSACPRAG